MIDEETMVRSVLARTAATGEPDVAGVDAVFAKAGRLRTRRRLRAGLLVGGAIAGVSTVLVLNSGAGVTVAPQGGPAAAPVPVASAGATLKGLTEPGAVLANLIRLLPSTVATESPYSEEGFGEVVVSDAAGRGKVIVNVQPLFFEGGEKPGGSDVDAGLYDCATRSIPAGQTCQARTLADGTKLVVVTGNDGALQFRQIDALRPGRLRVVAQEWNAVDVKHGPATRPELMLSAAQLEALAIDPSWNG